MIQHRRIARLSATIALAGGAFIGITSCGGIGSPGGEAGSGGNGETGGVERDGESGGDIPSSTSPHNSTGIPSSDTSPPPTSLDPTAVAEQGTPSLSIQSTSLFPIANAVGGHCKLRVEVANTGTAPAENVSIVGTMQVYDQNNTNVQFDSAGTGQVHSIAAGREATFDLDFLHDLVNWTVQYQYSVMHNGTPVDSFSSGYVLCG